MSSDLDWKAIDSACNTGRKISWKSQKSDKRVPIQLVWKAESVLAGNTRGNKKVCANWNHHARVDAGVSAISGWIRLGWVRVGVQVRIGVGVRGGGGGRKLFGNFLVQYFRDSANGRRILKDECYIFERFWVYQDIVLLMIHIQELHSPQPGWLVYHQTGNILDPATRELKVWHQTLSKHY